MLFSSPSSILESATSAPVVAGEGALALRGLRRVIVPRDELHVALLFCYFNRIRKKLLLSYKKVRLIISCANGLYEVRDVTRLRASRDLGEEETA